MPREAEFALVPVGPAAVRQSSALNSVMQTVDGEQTDGLVREQAVEAAAAGDGVRLSGNSSDCQLSSSNDSEQAPGIWPTARSSAGRTSIKQTFVLFIRWSNC